MLYNKYTNNILFSLILGQEKASKSFDSKQTNIYIYKAINYKSLKTL